MRTIYISRDTANKQKVRLFSSRPTFSTAGYWGDAKGGFEIGPSLAACLLGGRMIQLGEILCVHIEDANPERPTDA